jgi:7-cyano-7-deazaguanine synthase
LPASFVPNRNAIFFTLAHAFAQKQGIEHIIIGVNQTDYSGYPDCREPFVKALELALNLGSEATIIFHYPLMHLTKAQTFELSKVEGVLDLVIDESHTCYNGVHTHKHAWGYGCGECPACVLRKQGFEEYESELP